MNDPNNNIVYSDIEAQKQNEETPLLPKGQLISEEFFLVIRYFKKQPISFTDFCPTLRCQINE